MPDRIIYSSGVKLKQSRKCDITGGWCASEEWPKDHPCKCDNCQAYLCETIDHLERLADEAIKIYRIHGKIKGLLIDAIRHADFNPEGELRHSEAMRYVFEALQA